MLSVTFLGVERAFLASIKRVIRPMPAVWNLPRNVRTYLLVAIM